MASDPPIHVLPQPRGGWQVRREGDDQPISEHDSETAAERAATEQAGKAGKAGVIVHDRYTRVHRAS